MNTAWSGKAAPGGGSLLGGARTGILPGWAPYGVFAGALAVCAAVLAALGIFTIALTLVFGAIVAVAGIYAWSRAIEGPRRAKDRAITMAIVAAFGVAMAPLISLLYEVIQRGVPGLHFYTLNKSRSTATIVRNLGDLLRLPVGVS